MTPQLPPSAPQLPASADAAKARLLAWADDADARSRSAAPSSATLAVAASLALVSGLSLSRLLSRRTSTPTHHPLLWAALLRFGPILLPRLVPFIRIALGSGTHTPSPTATHTLSPTAPGTTPAAA
jgi:hypothetical protein